MAAISCRYCFMRRSKLRRSFVQTSVADAFITGRFRQPLFIGRLTVERARWKQLAIGDGDGTKFHGQIFHVSPFVHVLPAVIDPKSGSTIAHRLQHRPKHCVSHDCNRMPLSVIEYFVLNAERVISLTERRYPFSTQLRVEFSGIRR